MLVCAIGTLISKGYVTLTVDMDEYVGLRYITYVILIQAVSSTNDAE